VRLASQHWYAEPKNIILAAENPEYSQLLKRQESKSKRISETPFDEGNAYLESSKSICAGAEHIT